MKNKSKTNTLLILDTLPPAAKEIYSLLKEKMMTASEIKKFSKYSDRSIRSALKLLYKFNLIEKVINLSDLRFIHYKIKD